jgi:hypothetical protein
MPRNLPHWTHCAEPGQAKEAPVGEIVAWFIGGFTMGAGITGLVGALLGEAASLGCVLGAALVWAAVAALSDFIYWYDNRRLMCLKGDQCVVGTVVTKPSVATDGDVGLNVSLAPFTPTAQLKALKARTGSVDVVSHMQAMPTRDDVVHLLQDVVHNDLLSQPGKDFQKRFIVTTSSVNDVHPNASNHIPDDSYVASGPTNPMFRGPLTDDPAENPSSITKPWFYMHTEIEGHNLVAWLENLRDALIAGGVAWMAACALCAALTGAEWLCGWVGALAAFLIALLVWLIKQFGTNEPYDASIPDVDVPDDFATPATSGGQGDVVVVFGDWVMDMEHHKYFELHPVKAWYRICSLRGFPLPIMTGEVPAGCTYDPATMTPAEYARICSMIAAAETTDPPSTNATGLTASLSMLAGIRTDTPTIK